MGGWQGSGEKGEGGKGDNSSVIEEEKVAVRQ